MALEGVSYFAALLFRRHLFEPKPVVAIAGQVQVIALVITPVAAHGLCNHKPDANGPQRPHGQRKHNDNPGHGASACLSTNHASDSIDKISY